MAKKKTRKQKILADQRHILYHLETTPAQVSHSSEKKAKLIAIDYEMPQVKTQTLTSFAYVISDIRKTAFITFSIIIAQIILFIILHRV